MGRLTKDPEIRYTQSSTAVCNFTLAVNRRFKKDEADFIPVVVWGKQAEFCNSYFQKGLQVAIVGRLQVSSWDDNDGKRHYKTEVVAEETYFADGKPSGKQEEKKEDSADREDEGYYAVDVEDDLPF